MARILIADDALFMRFTLKRTLTQAGHEVVAECENGQQAIEKYGEVQPDLVFLDITMPELDGLSALHAIRESDDAARVIMCSALGHGNKVREALDAGARDFIVKPFTPERILEAVNKALA